jgi:hypothetical protein
MAATRGKGRLAIARGALAAGIVVALSAARAGAEAPSPAPTGLRASIAVLAGPSKLDRALADYEWDTSPAWAWGLRALVGRGRLAAGARLWTTETTQTIELPSGTTAPRVRATSLELVGEARVASWANVDVLARGSAGRLHLGYHPDRVSVDVGSGVPTEVPLAPIDEWIGGVAAGLRTRITDRVSTGVELERRFFGIDTAHRRGTEIVTGRQSFGDWSARLELAWAYGSTR